jgi:hypothetical protein
MEAAKAQNWAVEPQGKKNTGGLLMEIRIIMAEKLIYFNALIKYKLYSLHVDCLTTRL